MRESIERWLKDEPLELTELSPDLRPLAVMLGRAILDMDKKIDNVHARLQEVTAKYDGHLIELHNVPAELKKPNAQEAYTEYQQKVDLMWGIGKWLAGGVGAGLMFLIGKVFLNSLGV